jgi:hypothetical protein
VVGGIVLAVVLLEVGGRLLKRSCDRCWGKILGMELPPFRLLMDSDIESSRLDEPFDSLVVKGVRVTAGDLWGVYREDSVLGYAPVENARSTNGWYVTNGMGARSTVDADSVRPEGVVRILAFGDSFGAGSRVREFEAWSWMLNERSENLDVVNFSVDGYSMAQAYLRYTVMEKELEYDWIVALFPPSATQWREINTFRNLRDWRMPLPVPRFVLDDQGVHVVRGPYSTVEEVHAGQ